MKVDLFMCRRYVVIFLHIDFESFGNKKKCQFTSVPRYLFLSIEQKISISDYKEIASVWQFEHNL